MQRNERYRPVDALRQLDHLRVRAFSTPRQARMARLIACGGLCGVAALSAYARFQPQSAAPCATDFGSMYYSALAIRGGAAPYGPLASWISTHAGNVSTGPFTDTSCLTGMLEFTYTPFFAIVLIPFTWLPYHAALWLWDACELLLLAGAIYAFLRAARVPSGATLLLSLTSAAILASPLRFELYYAQVDLFLLFFICAALWARSASRGILPGVLLAVACASQPLLLVVLLFLVRKREVRFAAITLAGTAVLVFAPFLWLGAPALRDMLTMWSYYAGSHAASFTNNAPRGVLLRLLAGAPQLATAVWLVVAIAVLGIVLWRTAPSPLGSDSRSLLDAGLFVAAVLLASPWSENGNFTLLLVSFLAAYVYVRQSGTATTTARAILIKFACALALFYVLGDTVQYALHAHMAGAAAISYVYTVLDAVYLYPLLAIAAVLIYAQRSAATTTDVSAAGTPDMFRHDPTARSGITSSEMKTTGLGSM